MWCIKCTQWIFLHSDCDLTNCLNVPVPPSLFAPLCTDLPVSICPLVTPVFPQYLRAWPSLLTLHIIPVALMLSHFLSFPSQAVCNTPSLGFQPFSLLASWWTLCFPFRLSLSSLISYCASDVICPDLSDPVETRTFSMIICIDGQTIFGLRAANKLSQNRMCSR